MIYEFEIFILLRLKMHSFLRLRVKSIENYQRYSLSNHLYWLSKGEPGGHNKWSFLSSSAIDVAYSKSLEKIKKTDTLIAYACIE